MSGYVEGLLRPADELQSAGMFALAGVAIALFPEVFLLPPVLVPGTVICLFVCACWRYRQGMAVLAYRKGLLQMPYWGVAPISAKSPKLALSPLFTMAESI
ncbi:hypothetical protein [Vibrio campbellii]